MRHDQAAQYSAVETSQSDDVDIEGGKVTARNLMQTDQTVAAGHSSWTCLKVSSLMLVAVGLVLVFFYGQSRHAPHFIDQYQGAATNLKAVVLSDKVQKVVKHLNDVKNNITAANASKASKVVNSSRAHHAHHAHGAHGAAHSVESVESVESDSDCHTALPHEPCYQAVLWHKWVGMVENPTWYKNVSRTSNRHAIQKYLADTRQGKCKQPCSGAYPVPHPKKNEHLKVYCFSVARGGTEMDTMFMQRQVGGGIFGCDGFDVFSSEEIDIDGYKTKLIPSTASGVSVDGTAANSQVFLKTWMAILNSKYWFNYDFIAKVDPDAILYPDRLRGHLQWHVGQNVFFLNCAKYIPATMYGALEVFSKAALGAYLSQHQRCEQSLPFWSWGEDRYMANCLEMLGVHTQPDYLNFLHDERCWGVDCGNKAAVAFHSFKQVNHWFRCYEASK